MRNEGLDNEVIQDAGDNFDLALLIHALLNPLHNFGPGLVNSQQARLSSALDQLVGLDDKLRLEQPGVLRGQGIERSGIFWADTTGGDEEGTIFQIVLHGIGIARKPPGRKLLAMVLTNGFSRHIKTIDR